MAEALTAQYLSGVPGRPLVDVNPEDLGDALVDGSIDLLAVADHILAARPDTMTIVNVTPGAREIRVVNGRNVGRCHCDRSPHPHVHVTATEARRGVEWSWVE